MKKLVTLIILFVSVCSYGFTQQVNPISTNTVNNGISGTLVSNVDRVGSSQVLAIGHLRLRMIDKSILKESIDLEKKKYLRYDYELASVDNYDTKAYVRYNVFNDEIEFIKETNIYYLVKEVGRRIKFRRTKVLYKVYQLDKNMHFFKVHVDGENSLIAKQRVRYIEPKIAQSGYDRAKPGDYRRVKDELYLAKGNNELIKISSKKKEFYAAFGNQSEVIKMYSKENKLNYRKLEDIKQIVEYYNDLLKL